MSKLKILQETRTVWLQETKQVIVELPDGKALGIRVMEDDNGVEHYYQIKPTADEIYKRADWVNEYEMQWESEEIEEAIKRFANTIFYGDYEENEIIETDELDEVW